MLKALVNRRLRPREKGYIAPGGVHPMNPGQMEGHLVEVSDQIRRSIHCLPLDKLDHQVGDGKDVAGCIQGQRFRDRHPRGAENPQQAKLIGRNPGIPPPVGFPVLTENHFDPPAVRPLHLQQFGTGRNASRQLSGAKQPVRRIDFPDHPLQARSILGLRHRNPRLYPLMWAHNHLRLRQKPD